MYHTSIGDELCPSKEYKSERPWKGLTLMQALVEPDFNANREVVSGRKGMNREKKISSECINVYFH